MRPGLLILVTLLCAASPARPQPAASRHSQIVLTVVDENDVPVSGAEVTILQTGLASLKVWTDYAGRCQYTLRQTAPYNLTISKTGYYTAQESALDPRQPNIQTTVAHQHLLEQQVQVTATAPVIDPQEPTDRFSLDTPEITNVPYPTSRDIRNLLPFVPGVVADASGQVHVAGSETWQTLDTLDGFDIRSPASGLLAMRVSADAVRSIDIESTRYPVQYGRTTGGVVAFYTGNGDNRFRFNATDFVPSFRSQKGLRFDKIDPRFTFSGPIIPNRAWFFDGFEMEYDDIFIPELPSNADTNHLIRGSNLIKLQAQASRSNTISAGLLYNGYHSPYDGISPLVPQQSTTKRDTIAWLPYLRDQQRFSNGTLLDAGFGIVRFHDGYEPHPGGPYELTPETALGSFFENLTGISRREEGNATLYFPEHRWLGNHDIRAGIDQDHVEFGETIARAPVNYLRENGTLLRQSVFPFTPPFSHHDAESAVYIEDHWTTGHPSGLLIEPGLRFDWDEIIRRPLFSPRVAVVYAPGSQPTTKISAGVGLYYEHTQLEYLERALAGMRFDTYYNSDGVTPSGPPLPSAFTYDQRNLREAHAINWSLGLEQKLPSSIYAAVNFIDKRVSHVFTYSDLTSPAALFGNFALTNNRSDHDYDVEVEARRNFGGNYTVIASYTHSSARTNAAIDYLPTVSPLGPQQSGPLPWNTPNRVISWGWLPLELPWPVKNWFRKNWDFVYTLDWHNGFPITSIDANQRVAGAVGSHSFPNFLSFSPGVEWRFHLFGRYVGLRGVLENATDSQNYAIVNNNISSPHYLTFSEPLGRAFTTRIRLIQSKNQ